MGLGSSTYENLLTLIESNNLVQLKECLSQMSNEEVRRLCCESNEADEFGRTLVHHAVWTENSAALKILYEFCNDSWIESKDYYGMTPLAASVNCGNRNAVAFLLDINASINCDEANGYFLLRTAVSNNSTEIVEMLLNKGCVVEEQETDFEIGSLLHLATSLGNLKIVKLLVELGKMPVKVEDRFKVQPIHIASTTNQLDTLKYLEENGADLNVEDAFGNNPLGWAKHFKSVEVIEYLKEKQAEDKPFKNLDEIRKFVSLEMKQEQEKMEEYKLTEYRKDGKIADKMVMYSKNINNCVLYGIENLNFQSESQSITNV